MSGRPVAANARDHTATQLTMLTSSAAVGGDSRTISKIRGGLGLSSASGSLPKVSAGEWLLLKDPHLDLANRAEKVRGVTALRIRTNTGDSLPV